MSAERVAAWLSQTGALRSDAISVKALAPFLMERMRALPCASGDAYLALLTQCAQERSRVVAACAPSETWLFRYAASYEYLRRHLRGTTRAIRVLSAGSGGLAEPASIVASLASAGVAVDRISVDAIDQSVDAARAPNVFAEMLAREPLPSWAVTSFESCDSTAKSVRLRAALAARISLVQGDLRTCVLQGPYDAIFFRNVAIYLPDDVRAKILAQLKTALAVDGVLFVGHAEMRVAEQAGFAPIAEVGAFALRARVAKHLAPDAPPPLVGAFVCAPPRFDLAEPVERATIECIETLTALAHARSAVAEDPSCAALHEALAVEEVAQGDTESAEGSLRRALYLEQTRESALLALAVLLDAQGRTIEAERFRARALRAHLVHEGGAS